ncbi:MAG: peptidylprolyl isomerase [Clostridia bacterium]|nr:peptidylprolyl isomerase [Clostridia bacterium]
MAKILATVGTLNVTEDEVNEFIASLGQRGAAYNNPEGRRAVLNQLIGNKLLLLDARRNLYEGEAAFRDQLAKLKESLLINYAGEKAISGAKVDDAEARTYFDENQDQFMKEETVNASHILTKTEEEAAKILADIRAGKVTFEDAAREFSTCPSKNNGGNLGDFGKGQMVPEFDSAVFAMEVGEITDAPVKTQFGYHLIKLNAKNPAEAMNFADVKEDLKAMLLSEKQRKAYESKINQLKIMYPVDMMTL